MLENVKSVSHSFKFISDQSTYKVMFIAACKLGYALATDGTHCTKMTGTFYNRRTLHDAMLS